MSYFWGRNGTVPVQGGHRVVSRIRREPLPFGIRREHCNDVNRAQQGDMTRADLISILMNMELEEHRNLTREQARAVVNEIFGAIAEALRNGEVARLPFGSLGVYEQDRQPKRGWFLNRVRVLYKQRNMIKFLGGEYDLEPADQGPPTLSRSGSLPRRQPPHRLDNNGEMKPSERNSPPPKISPPERRKLTAIGVKAGKSRRLIAQELNVTETTIRRDLEVQGITANKKPTATRRKPAVVWKGSSRATSDRKVASQNPTKPHQPTPRNKDISPRIVVPKPLKPRPPKHRSPEIPLSPEELRRQHLEEMLQLVQSWLVERYHDYQHATNVLDKARILLATRRDLPVRELPESPMSADQLLHHTRPQEMDSASSQNRFRGEEACALWLARWLAAWAPQDKQLRNDVLDQARARLSA
jgi:nucleoid DNA-binding protein